MSADKRPQLINFSFMTILVLMLSAIFMVLVHGRNSFDNERFDMPPDALSEAYLKVFLKAEPNNHSVRLKLANHYLAIGEWSKAQRLLQEGGTSLEALPEMKWLMLQVILAQYSALPMSSHQRQEYRRTIRDQIAAQDLAGLTTDQILQLADLSLQIGAPDYAATYYVIMAKRDTGNAWNWYAEAGRWALAANNLEEAAAYYEMAYQRAPDPDTAAMLAEETLRVYEASVGVERALDMIRRVLESHPPDRRTLERGIAMAMAQQHYELARKWNLLRLQDQPNDLTALVRQIDLTVHAGLKEEAFEYSKRYIDLVPEDNTALRRHAQLAEWNSRYPEALKAWQTLALRTEDPEIYLHMLNFAQAEFDVDFELKTIAYLETRTDLKESDVLHLAARYEYLGYPERADRLLIAFGRSNPQSRELLLFRADLHERTGDLEKALESRLALCGGPDARPDDHVETARLLFKLGRIEEAYKMMRGMSSADMADNDYAHQLTGELAWLQGNYEMAAQAYLTLWRKYPGDDFSRQRLIVAKQQLGRTEEAVTLLLEHWQRSGDRKTLLAALSAARQAELWPVMNRLFVLAEAIPNQFAADEDYWILKGDWHSYRFEYPEAYRSYRQALTLNSRSTTAAEGILWSLINAKDHDRLNHWVNHHIRSGLPLTEAHVAALQMLGRHSEALLWYQEQFRHHQNDVLWLLDFADLLEKVGSRNAAYKVRRHAIGILIQQKQSLTDDRVAEIIAGLHGIPVASRWLESLSEPAEKAAIVNWWLYRQHYETARIRLLQHHIERSKLPAWQQIQLAMVEDDHAAVVDLLEGGLVSIEAADRMNAYTFLGRNDLSLSEVGRLADMGPEHRLAAAAAAAKLHNLWGTAMSSSRIGELGIRNFEGIYLRNRGDYEWGLLGGLSTFEEDDDLIVASLQKETRLTGSWRRYRDDLWSMKIGYRDGNGGDAFPLSLTYRSTDRRRWQYQFELQSQSPTTVSGLMRALGVQDRLGAQLDYQLDPRLSFSMGADRHHYEGLDGGSLADGNSLNFNVRYRLFDGMNQWLIGGSAAWEDNDVVDRVPTRLRRLLNPGVGTEALVPETYRDIGLSMYLGRGQLPSTLAPVTNLISASPRWFTDLWVGYIEPESTLGSAVRAGVSMSLFGGDEFGLTVSYDDRLSKVASGGASHQIQLFYRFHLGR